MRAERAEKETALAAEATATQARDEAMALRVAEVERAMAAVAEAEGQRNAAGAVALLACLWAGYEMMQATGGICG